MNRRASGSRDGRTRRARSASGSLSPEPADPGSASAEPSFPEQVYALVRLVPRGRIVSYGGVAALLGRPRAARAVGRALFDLPEGHDVPWWRVVNRNGEISIKGVLHGPAIQRALLEKERIRFDRAGRIDWERFGWSADDLPRTADGAVDVSALIRPVHRRVLRK